MSSFTKKFFTLLEQDGQEQPPTPDEAAMASTLDAETDPAALGADINAQAATAVAQQQQQMIGTVQGWIVKLDEFVKYLNSPTGESIQNTLKDATPDTILDKIRTTETKKIARSAMDLAALSQIFQGYLATARDPKYKGV
jgi:PPE-repeat protein